VAARLNPYISFAGNAREAMEFYERVFGGTLTLNTTLRRAWNTALATTWA
jgi:uncharacterized glyoxalase superfamily protein PhnB